MSVGNRTDRPTGALGGTLFALALSVGISAAHATPAASDDGVETALHLATLLRSARTVVSVNQDKINDPALGDKGLTGPVVVAKAAELFESATGTRLDSSTLKTRQVHLLSLQAAAIREVVDEHQSTINKQGVGFKGFVPAIFTRLVNERFARKAGAEAEIKVTAPRPLVRNRKALPDAFEERVIAEYLMSPEWPKGKVFAESHDENGKEVVRVLVPEYYKGGCLACHGGPAGELDVTGYPKEGGNLGDLGGVISIRLMDHVDQKSN